MDKVQNCDSYIRTMDNVQNCDSYIRTMDNVQNCDSYLTKPSLLIDRADIDEIVTVFRKSHRSSIR
jgi:hypothetical protein